MQTPIHLANKKKRIIDLETCKYLKNIDICVERRGRESSGLSIFVIGWKYSFYMFNPSDVSPRKYSRTYRKRDQRVFPAARWKTAAPRRHDLCKYRHAYIGI